MRSRAKSTRIQFDIPTLVGKETAQWSFSRASRFRPPSSSSYSFYNLPTSFNKRSCGFGYGKRWNPMNQKGKHSPAPNVYNIFPIRQKKGWVIGQASRQTKKNFQQNPGPGSYQPYSPIGKSGRKFSISPKLKQQKKYENPSPAAYNPKFRLIEKSAYEGISFGIGERQEESFDRRRASTPGPGSYQVLGCVSSAFKGPVILQ